MFHILLEELAIEGELVDEVGDGFEIGGNSIELGLFVERFTGFGWLEGVVTVIQGDNKLVIGEPEEDFALVGLGDGLHFNHEGWV